MMIVRFLAKTVESMFVLGILGCTVVLILTLIEDAKMLFGKDEKAAH